ncbi:MAG: bifunctional 5,10-methylenetetrahydrofolate dehydrogenase/5,10-methenyltetrahydrofolate cyclohydrolase [Elusimicrobiales bacterium]|nr:bifunctional 5,10-methylenetetrahydrofolate dehydrogenase/5,10-methenyltetrahydrofolate cyclohydrolase [Elusimicrobiales bacterium]
MIPKILEGKTLAAEIRCSLPARIAAAQSRLGRKPLLAAVHCPGDYASDVYLKKELKACEKTGIAARAHEIAKDTTPSDFIKLLRQLGSEKSVDAILVPRPLPRQLSDAAIWEHLDPKKDIDGASVSGMGRLFLCKTPAELEAGGFFMPCTAWAVIRLLRRHGINPSGRNAAVLGRSSTVGRPLAHMLSCLDATVTLAHSKTADIAKTLSGCELVVSAVGKARWVKADMLRPGAVVVDVGTNSDENGVFCGDVDYDAARETASAISPVPGGVGPVTLACLLENIVSAFEKSA